MHAEEDAGEADGQAVEEYIEEELARVAMVVVVAQRSDHHGQMKVVDSSARTECHEPGRMC